MLISDQERILNDFRYFVYVVWKHLNLPDPTPVQYDIAKYIQTAPDKCVVEAFRGIGKSYVTSAFVCWLLLRDPQLKIMVVSASKTRSDDFTSFTKRLIEEIPMLQHLAPKQGQRDSKIAFDVAPALTSHSPSVKSVGIMGQLTGSRADLIIADDIEVPNNSDTQGMRDKLSERVREFSAILKPEGRIIYLGTPQTEMSLYNQLSNRGYEIRIWPARYPDEKAVESYEGRLAPWIVDNLSSGTHVAGDAVDPKRFTRDMLMEKEAHEGRSFFALQYMLDTSLSDQNKYPLKLSDLIVMDIDSTRSPVSVSWGRSKDTQVDNLPADGLANDRFYRPIFMSETWSEYQGSVMAIDPSGRGSDKTAYSIIKMLNGFLYLVDQGALDGGYDETTLRKLSGKALEHKVNVILIESNFGDGMFTKLFQPILGRVHPCTVEEVRHNTQKELRIIDTLEPVMNQHRLVVDASLIERDYREFQEERLRPYRLFYQLTRITKEKGALAHDDSLDCLAMAVRYWTDQLGTDVEAAERRFEQEAFEKSINDFTRGFEEREDRYDDTWM